MTHLKPRSTTVVLYQGDDMDRLAELKRAVSIAERISEQHKDAARRGDDDQSVADAQNAYDTFVDEAAARALEVELHSIGMEFFHDLLLEHPPRRVPKDPAPSELPPPGQTVFVSDEMMDHPDDAAWGVNTETFPFALLTFRKMDEDGDDGPEVVATIARPEFASDPKVQRFVKRELAAGDFDKLWISAFLLNRQASGDPKASGYGTAFRSMDEM